MGEVVLQAIEVKVDGGEPPPLSFEVRRGEIHGLLFPPDMDRSPFLRVLAGEQHPHTGRVEMPSGPVHVRMSEFAETVSGPFGPQSDVVLVDAPPPANDRHAHDAWVRIASERELGATIVLATSHEELAYRSDRVSLVMWDEGQLRDAFVRLTKTMQSLVEDFLSLLHEGRYAPQGLVATRLLRFNQATRDLLREARRVARSYDQTRRASALAADVAQYVVDDRVLQAAIRRGHGD